MLNLKILKFNWDFLNDHPFHERVYRALKLWFGGRIYYHPNSFRRKPNSCISGK